MVLDLVRGVTLNRKGGGEKGGTSQIANAPVILLLGFLVRVRGLHFQILVLVFLLLVGYVDIV